MGTPMALAASRTPTGVQAAATDTATATADPLAGVAATDTTSPSPFPSVSATDTTTAIPTDTASAVPSVTASGSSSSTASSSASSTASSTASPSATTSTPAAISPDTQTLIATAGQPIAGTTSFTASSGMTDPVTYIVSPKLPVGLTMSSTTGVIDGTPTTAQKATDYTVTGTESAGSSQGSGSAKPATAQATITITVRPDLIPNKQSLDLKTDTDMPASEPLVETGFPDPVTYTVLPALPDPLVMDPATGVITGIPTTAQSATTYVVTGTDGTFTATADITITITCGPPGSAPPACTPPPLALGGTDPSALLAVPSLLSYADSPDPIHGPYSMQTDTCARCHRTHTAAAAPALQRAGANQSELCISCHNGTGAPSGAPAMEYPNNPDSGTRVPNVADEYVAAGNAAGFSHNIAPSAGNAHTLYQSDDGEEPVPTEEFLSASLTAPDRHAECTDCHNPHNSSGGPQSYAPRLNGVETGWTASGRIQGASGVAVTNGSAGQTPTFTYLNGLPLTPDGLPLTPDQRPGGTQMTREYQLCFKCHSGYTNLGSRTDLAVQFNPNNPSFHPVEAAGTNQTVAMGLSLAGNSYSKVWNFATETPTGSGKWVPDQTVRCVHCHAYQAINTTDVNGKPVTVPSDPHAAPASAPLRKNILLNNYDPSLDNNTFVENDFALCFSCHANDPFPGRGNKDDPAAVHGQRFSTATNFKRHSLHSGSGVGCPQCHYDSHSTTTGATDVGQIHGVKLAPSPDIVPDPGTKGITITRALSGSVYQYTVTCTLTCHTVPHDGTGTFRYTYTDPN